MLCIKNLDRWGLNFRNLYNLLNRLNKLICYDDDDDYKKRYLAIKVKKY